MRVSNTDPLTSCPVDTASSHVEVSHKMGDELSVCESAEEACKCVRIDMDGKSDELVSNVTNLVHHKIDPTEESSDECLCESRAEGR